MRVLYISSMVLAAACGLLAAPTSSDAPAFCKGLECPEFKLLDKFEGYEMREYESSKWIVVDINGMDSDFWENRSKATAAFMRLFGYISGANDKGQKMEMTAPVLLTHTKDKVSMAFMIPGKFVKDTPKPADPELRLYTAEGSKVYVRSFGGFPYGPNKDKNQYQVELETLKAQLNKDGNSYNGDVFYTAGYDGPRDTENRHNEVWLYVA